MPNSSKKALNKQSHGITPEQMEESVEAFTMFNSNKDGQIDLRSEIIFSMGLQ